MYAIRSYYANISEKPKRKGCLWLKPILGLLSVIARLLRVHLLLHHVAQGEAAVAGSTELLGALALLFFLELLDGQAQTALVGADVDDLGLDLDAFLEEFARVLDLLGADLRDVDQSLSYNFV